MTFAWLSELKKRWQEALSKRGRCPACQGQRVWYNGIRRRKVSLWEGGRVVFIADVPVRRLRCGDCARRWSRAPERVVSRAHYQPCVVAAAVAEHGLHRGGAAKEQAARYGCHRRTLLRWVSRVAGLGDPAQLARRLAQEAQSPELPAVPSVRPRRSAALEERSQRAVWVLALLDALGSCLGLGPPGLAHAWCFVPAFAPPSEEAP